MSAAEHPITQLAALRTELRNEHRSDLQYLREKMDEQAERDAACREDLARTLGAVNSSLKSLEAHTTRLNSAVFGSDGRGGLVTDVAIVKSSTASWRWYLMAFLTAVAAASGLWAAAAEHRDGREPLVEAPAYQRSK